MRYAIVTFGCRVNQADSLRIEAQLRAAGGESVQPEEAELVVVNTCSVTATADQGTRQAIRRIARSNPSVRVVATGCYATRCGDEVAALPNVIRVIPNDDKDDIVPALGEDAGPSTAVRYGHGEGHCGAFIEPGTAGRTAFTLRVQTGCDEACTYCIIPATRGRGRSLPLPAVLAEIDRAVQAGFKEIVLTGVHLGSYGRDLTPPCTLGDLLRALAGREDGALFRLSSLEPMDCTPDIVSLVAGGGAFAPSFHLPLQHGSDRVLARMRRLYTLAHYERLVRSIREAMPHAAIGSDLIVGFPAETDAEFHETLSYLEDSPLTSLHVFPYSDRPGTPAAAIDAKIEGPVIRARAQAAREAGARLAARFRAGQVGRVRRSLTLEDGSSVITDNNLKVRIPPGRRRNEWVDVRIVDAGGLLAGVVVGPPSSTGGTLGAA